MASLWTTVGGWVLGTRTLVAILAAMLWSGATVALGQSGVSPPGRWSPNRAAPSSATSGGAPLRYTAPRPRGVAGVGSAGGAAEGASNAAAETAMRSTTPPANGPRYRGGLFDRPWPTAKEVSTGVVIAAPQTNEPPAAEAAPEQIEGEAVDGDVMHGEGCQCPICAGGGDLCRIGCGGPWWDNLSVFGGVHGFKGPMDLGQNGNFGFHEGVNYAIPLSYCCNVGAQVGIGIHHSDFSGTAITTEDRTQTFFTAGLFHRTEYGFQYGAVFDWLHDTYYVQMDVHQVRAELSWVSTCGRELGILAAVSTNDDDTMRTVGTTTQIEFWKTTDQVALFLRTPFAYGGEGRIFGGATSDREGILGGDATVPVSDCWSLQAAANYRIPEASKGTGTTAGHVGESWGLTLNLVWTPGAPLHGDCPNMFRPLFNVADNSNLFVDRRAE